MWECFGISWACSQLMNSALRQLVHALATSLTLSRDCSPDSVEQCTPSDVFTALGALTESRGAMEDIDGSCSLKGSPPPAFLNPMAATPAELRPASPAPAPPPAGMLSLLAVPEDTLSADVAEQIEEIASALDASLHTIISTSVEAIEAKKTAVLVEAVDDVLKVLGKELPAFFDLVSETNALDADPALDTMYGGRPAVGERDLLVMLEFVVTNGPITVSRVTGAAEGFDSDTEFLEVVDAKLQKAKTFLSQALVDAWEGVRLQLPRIHGIASEVSTDGVTEEERLQWAECASSYASALGQLTSLYSNLESSGAECNSTDTTFYNERSCESDLVSDMSAISLSINEASKMMASCFQRDWSCTGAITTASNAMLNAVGNIIAMKANCGDEDGDIPRDVCETSVTKLLGNLGAATRATRATMQACKAPRSHDDARAAAHNLTSEVALGNFVAVGSGAAQQDAIHP
eukprot:TRINITY_DN9248_c0_g1_i2.p1 TRINITY_DN9248_c0_g1~~TRINITY_DN9248_c0_g1_i2.p1  ORF type:complete len:504 (-),score=110.66 TRINITY_DN9248_c0_g1_i2:223-1611(-)